MEGISFAAKDAVDTLYKFRAFYNDDLKKRVREIVLDNKIYFSRRSQLNDPFDLQPVFELDRTGGELQARKRLLIDAEASYQRQGLPRHEIVEKLATLAVCELERFEAGARERAWHRFENEYLVFSTAGNRTHPMLWSHYADGHKGLCIHFSAGTPSVFRFAMKVQYHAARARMFIPVPDELELVLKATLWKGEFWNYEHEYRLVRFPKPEIDYTNYGLTYAGQRALFHPEWVTGITVGAYMPDSHVAEVLEMADQHKPNPLPVWKAKPTLTYELTFDRIA